MVDKRPADRNPASLPGRSSEQISADLEEWRRLSGRCEIVRYYRLHTSPGAYRHTSAPAAPSKKGPAKSKKLGPSPKETAPPPRERSLRPRIDPSAPINWDRVDHPAIRRR